LIIILVALAWLEEEENNEKRVLVFVSDEELVYQFNCKFDGDLLDKRIQVTCEP
jgi:hypothetical protein